MIALPANRLGRKVATASQIDGESEHHADTGRDEAQMPINPLAQGAADERRNNHGQLDTEKIDLETVGAPRIVHAIERPNLASDVGLEAADAGQQQQ